MPPTRLLSIPVSHEEQMSATCTREEDFADRVGRERARIGKIAAPARIFPDATSDATEIEKLGTGGGHLTGTLCVNG